MWNACFPVFHPKKSIRGKCFNSGADYGKYAIIRQLGSGNQEPYLERLVSLLDPCLPIADQILAELVENPPVLAHKGNMIRSGVNAELDLLRNIASNGKQYLAELAIERVPADRHLVFENQL